MKYPFEANVTFHFNAPQSRVWKGLTDPELVKTYFFGTELSADWKKGGKIFFRGAWEGTAYEDKGTILEIEPGKLLRYDYFSSFSGQEDLPENYGDITYLLTEESGGTRLDIIQKNIETAEKKTHSEENWKMLMGALRELLEKQA